MLKPFSKIPCLFSRFWFWIEKRHLHLYAERDINNYLYCMRESVENPEESLLSDLYWLLLSGKKIEAIVWSQVTMKRFESVCKNLEIKLDKECLPPPVFVSESVWIKVLDKKKFAIRTLIFFQKGGAFWRRRNEILKIEKKLERKKRNLREEIRRTSEGRT